jgi:hypothetical protein
MYRDEKEAAMARAEAAERRLAEMEQDQEAEEAELAELRAQVEQQRAEIARLKEVAGEAEQERERERRAREKKKREQAPEGRGLRAWFLRHRGLTIFVGALLLGVLTAGAIIAQHFAARWTGEAELDQAHVARLAGGGEALLVVGTVRHTGDRPDWFTHRIDLIDPRTGQRLAREVPDDDDRRPCLRPGPPGRCWALVAGGERLQVRELQELSVVASFEELARRNPALAAGLHGGVQVDLGRGDAIVTTERGDRLLIDGRTLKARAFSAKEETVDAPGSGTVMLAALRQAKILTAGQLKRGEGELVIDEYKLTTRQRAALAELPSVEWVNCVTMTPRWTTSAAGTEQGELSFRKPGDGPKEALHLQREAGAPYEALAPATTYLEPAFVTRRASGPALVLPGGGGVIVRHQESLDSRRSGLLLSRVTPAGKRAWTVRDVNGEVRLGYLAGELVVIAVKARSDRPGYILGIAYKDGAIRWRHEV